MLLKLAITVGICIILLDTVSAFSWQNLVSIFNVGKPTTAAHSELTQTTKTVIRTTLIPVVGWVKKDPECLMQIPGTGLFRGFTWPFYTFDSKMGECRVVLGVTVRLSAPNVFSSFKDCRAACCPNKSC